MRIAICDDEKRICELLSEEVEKFCPDDEIISYCSGGQLLHESRLFDILLLDIKMPDISGMDVAKELRNKEWQGILIFITGEENEVFNSFDVHPFHFLVKPVSGDKLKEVLAEAKKEFTRLGKMGPRYDNFINIQSGSSHIRVNLSHLRYAEVYDRKIILHMLKENIEYYGQLSALEKLVGKDFYRIHRSYLLNMRFVERYDRTSVTLIGKETLPISRRLYDGFLKAYMEYSRRRISR